MQYKNETAAHVITYGMDNSADFRALDIQLDGRGTSFTLQSPEGERKIKLNLIGKFNVYNVLSCDCGCLYIKYSIGFNHHILIEEPLAYRVDLKRLTGGRIFQLLLIMPIRQIVWKMF